MPGATKTCNRGGVYKVTGYSEQAERRVRIPPGRVVRGRLLYISACLWDGMLN